ncbi:MAG: hypothetical protein IJ030_00070 [Oscillospiraceae bacterium]|nr:hypothetical protein [Oscillospiraceae bacterium]
MAQGVDVQYIQFYTQGSAAKQIAPAISVHTGALPQVKKRKALKIYLDPVALIGTAVAICMLIMMFVGCASLQAEQKKTAAMVEQVELLRQENESLRVQYAAECDLEEVRETALALGMIPREEAAHTAIQLELPPVEVPPVSTWQKIGTFLAGLFA